jgi:TPP-dependent indolepyruvate ferredoxin oxidoreductase alpha subunit
MQTLKIDHEFCTECRMCYVACRELNLNAVYVAAEPLHRLEIDPARCLFPGCTACLPYCPAPGSMVEAESGRSMVPPPPDVHRWSLKGRMR